MDLFGVDSCGFKELLVRRGADPPKRTLLRGHVPDPLYVSTREYIASTMRRKFAFAAVMFDKKAMQFQ